VCAPETFFDTNWVFDVINALARKIYSLASNFIPRAYSNSIFSQGLLIAAETQNFFIAWGNKDFRVD
jgi:hypothetical protein